MRTTLRIDDDVLEAAKSVARSTDRTLGEVISELARRGLAPSPQEESEEGFPVFAVSSDAKPITPEMVRRALDEP
jgi:hypothetical protein